MERERSRLIDLRWSPPLVQDGYCEGIVRDSVRPVASYSWVKKTHENRRPTIVVPGCPRIWRRRNYPFTIPHDQGTEYFDPNVVEFGNSPMHPLFLSVKLMEPDFQFENMDVITDKSVVRNILRWVQRKGGIRDFKVEVELYGNKTAVMFQPEAVRSYVAGLYRKTLELAHSDIPHGFESTFGHNRIINYKFGELDMLVRFPVDISNPQAEDNPTEYLSLPNGKSLRDAFTVKESQAGLAYIHHGAKIMYQNAMVELVVREGNSVIDWEKIWHQLYFSVTENLFVVSHNRQNVVGMSPSFLSRTGGMLRAIEESKSDLKNVEIILDKIRQYVISEKRRQKVTMASFKLRFDFFENRRDIEVHQIFTPSKICLD